MRSTNFRTLFLLFVLTIFVHCSDNSTGAEQVEPNQKPIFNKPLESIDYRENYVYKVNVTDPDGDQVVINITKTPEWLTYDADSKTFSGIPGYNNVGDHEVELSAFDGRSATFLAFTITVIMGPVDCGIYFGELDTALYVLPFQVGKTFQLFQGYCPPNPNLSHANSFAYDFDTAIGDTLLAMRAGTVTVVKEDAVDAVSTEGVGQPNTIFIRHADGTVVQYAHLKQNGVFVNVDDVVEQGQPIGLSGNSGPTAGPHVHIWVFRTNWPNTHAATVPIPFRNADGPVNAMNGLIQKEFYTALPFAPDSRE